MPLFPFPILPDVFDFIALVLLVVIGLFIIVVVVKLIVFLLPAAVVAFVVWFLTGSLFLAGIAFLVIAVISAAKR